MRSPTSGSYSVSTGRGGGVFLFFMATRKIFVDENSKMDVYINDQNKLYIDIAHDEEQFGFITLDEDDVAELIVDLTEYLKQMKEDGATS